MRRQIPAGLIPRLEAAAILPLLLLVYGRGDAGWLLFAALFLVPDLSAAGYLAGPRRGAVGYNLGHTWVGPAELGAFGIAAGWPGAVTAALIWGSHIAFDRILGYGLKPIPAAAPT